MAKIIENSQGRRLIRLSTEDVVNVVGLYQQKTQGKSTPKSYKELQSLFAQNPVYLPEEV